MRQMEKPTIWFWDDSANAYVDYTYSSSFPGMEDPNDRLYIGLSQRFESLEAVLSTLGSYSGFQIAYSALEDSWANTNLTYALDSSTTFYQKPSREWDRVCFTSAIPHAGTPPDDKLRYWWRFSATGVTTAAAITSINLTPYAYYASVDEVIEFLQTMLIPGPNTLPTEFVIEDYIRRHESYVDWYTKRTWRPRVVSSELHNMYDNCIKLHHFPISSITSGKYWNGSTWVSMTEGRERDFYADYAKGLVYLTRRIIPYIFYYYPTYRLSERGGLDFAYKWGQTLEEDPERAGLVEDIVIKRVSADILRMHDLTIVTKGGVDRLSVYDKIRELNKEAQDELDTLARVIME
jgi:hypothetical protein